MPNLYLLNSSILTSFGTYQYQSLEITDAIELLTNTSSSEITSAIGHQATAEVFSELMELEIEAKRISVQMQVGDKAIVFKLKNRLEENKVLTKKEMQELEYELGFLERIA
jgi:Domain of unknown function (DUF1874)